MELHGQHLIGFSTSRASGAGFAAQDPTSGAALAPEFADATPGEIDRACALAAAAHAASRRLPRGRRADLLESIADRLEQLGDALLTRATAETGLPAARLTMERGRTTHQLRAFAAQVRAGDFVDARIDHAQPDRQPIPKPDLRRMQVAVGPVAVFGASNFPLAFSVAGGDTASALAAGCPVVVKAHPRHPGTSELVGRAIVDAVRDSGLPEGTFSMLHGRGHDVGLGLVRHPAVAAVGFTGSLRGGVALFEAAAARPTPIPVYAEMGSINPVFLLPGALAAGPEALAEAVLQSVNLGVGQFCTNPGLIVVQDGEPTARFVEALGAAVTAAPDGVTLHAGIAAAYAEGVDHLQSIAGVTRIGRLDPPAACRAVPAVLTTDAATFLAQPALAEEVFGPSTLVVRCSSAAAVLDVARQLPGQLTATIHATPGELPDFAELVAELEARVGRLLFGGYPTGVEVCDSMQHGGPFPATTDVRATSVGSAALQRFTRPICYQNCPTALLPDELRDDNPGGIPQLVDGVRR